MPKPLSPGRLPQLAATALVLAGVSGCAQVDNWLRGSPREAVAAEGAIGAPQADIYISDMFKLASADPATQAEVFADAETAARLTPGPSTRLRYALALATPGHAEANPEEAQDQLRDLLSQSELLTESEIALATIHLADVEQRLMLGRETSRLRAANSQAASTEQRAVEQRIASIEAENRQLRQSLAEAEDKLEAITTIERSIREQSENGDTPP